MKKMKTSTFSKERMETCLNGESPHEDNSVPNRIRPSKQFGIYMIHCSINDWRYYGESNNISGRLSSHKSMLNRQIHPNKLLQADWDLYGPTVFEFIVLYIGKMWVDRVVRRGKELELIIHDRQITYNIIEGMDHSNEKNPFWRKVHTEETKKRISEALKGIPKESLGKKITIDGVFYSSLAEASRQTNHSRKLIRTRLNSELWPNWTIFEQYTGTVERPSQRE
uniref:GIY-YIG homing endonuclease n=1 Tax=Hydrocytium acuminatum TaxID=1745963 RepID=UPI002A7EDF74|nr:GIY-YIG homing endonuclease [Hydrocytium acuminatum]WOR09598.1 GIY-YIG homing endonuclease [Hydrocytium acuminatum]